MDVNVNAVHEGPGKLCDVALDIGRMRRHSRVRSLWKPQGHGFIAVANTNRAGNVSDLDARFRRAWNEATPDEAGMS